jgi:hypothetical protein
MTPVAVRSVENVMTALVVPERALLIFDVREMRFSMMLVDPVFQAKSVASTVRVFAHHARFVMTFDQLHVPRVAAPPFTVTLATHPVSDIVPKSVGVPLTTALFTWDVIDTTGAVVSTPAMTVTVRETRIELFPAVSVLEYWSI